MRHLLFGLVFWGMSIYRLWQGNIDQAIIWAILARLEDISYEVEKKK